MADDLDARLLAIVDASVRPEELNLVALSPVLDEIERRGRTRTLGLALEDSLRRQIVAVLRAQVAEVTSHSTVQMRPRGRRVRRSASTRGPPSGDDPEPLERRRRHREIAGADFVHLGDVVEAELERLRGARA